MFAHSASRSFLPFLLAATLAFGCDADRRDKRYGDSCADDTECASGICVDNHCLDPDGDLDGDALKNGEEKNLTRTNPALADSDGDGVPDLPEVGLDRSRPLDRDGDGLIDARESRLPAADPDGDCIPNEYDSRNDDPDVDPALLVSLGCSSAGVCGTGAAAIVTGCTDGVIRCDYAAVADWQADETACDGLDNDCDGGTDEDTVTDPTPADCSIEGVCGRSEVRPGRACTGGTWACVYQAIPGWEARETLCDGLDNNCDGRTDEDLAGGPCTTTNDIGTCAGTWKCAETGGGRVCDGPVPVEETCNGQDDNCDGDTDEGKVGVACTIRNDAGECAGLTVCDGEGGTLCDAPTPAPETCNGIDDDCEGGTDEDQVCLRTAYVKGTIRALPSRTTAFRLGATGGDAATAVPLAGAKVRVGQKGSCVSVPPADGFFDVLTGEDGTFRIAVLPGELCVMVEALGFEGAGTTDFAVATGEEYPIESILTPTGGATWLGSACGRVKTLPDGAVSLPVPGALVTASQVVNEALVELASTTADAWGFYCLAGWTIVPGSGSSVRISAVKDGYFPAEALLSPVERSIAIRDLDLRPVPTAVSVCLDDDFEASSEGATDASVPRGEPWTADPSFDGVGWQWLADGSLFDGAFDGCIRMPAEEDCNPGAAECLLCEEVPAPGCLPGPGTIPHAYSGTRAWWFGNPQTGSYLPSGQSCREVGKRLSGGLVSPWIPVEWVLDLALSFASAFEVESYDPKTDQMRVEIQTRAMDSTGKWSLIANLKDETAPQGQDSAVGLSTLGVGHSPAWKEFKFDLSAWSGSAIRLRFGFDSVDGNYNAFRGWLVDRVRVTGRGCTTGGTQRR